MKIEEMVEHTTRSIARWSDHFDVDAGLSARIVESTMKTRLGTLVMEVTRPALASECEEAGKALPLYRLSDVRASAFTARELDRMALERVVEFTRARTRQTTLLAMGESLFGPDWSWHAAACVVAMAQNAPDRYDPDTAGADYVMGERTFEVRPSYPPQKGETLFSNGRERRGGVAHVVGARIMLSDDRWLRHDESLSGYLLTINGASVPETVVPNFIGKRLSDLLDDPSLHPVTGMCRILDIENLPEGGRMRLRLDEPDVLLACPPTDADLSWLDIGRAEMRDAGALDPSVVMPWEKPSERKRR